MARELRDRAGWPYWAIGEAFGVSESRAWRWLNGDEQTYRQIEGRQRRPDTRPARRPASAPVVEGERWPDPVPGYLDEGDDLDDEEPAPATTRAAPRAKAKPPQPFGTWTPVVEAALARRGLDRHGRPLGQETATAHQEAAPLTSGGIPPPPDVRQPWTPPERPPTPAAPGVLAVELSCGHVERDLPLGGPWRERGWVACTRCKLAHRSIRRGV